jgi:hypothetical protein
MTLPTVNTFGSNDETFVKPKPSVSRHNHCSGRWLQKLDPSMVSKAQELAIQ